MTGDLAGFVAATYLRGIPVVQLPTSLVAMIDASIGGKTGVDVEAGKNLVGAFHPPNLVVADPDVVATLPGAERAQGMIEAVKHGAIMDDAYFAELDREMPAILDGETMKAFPGFGVPGNQPPPLTGDHLRKKIEWQTETDRVFEKPVCIRFFMHQARLYSFWLE